MLREALDKVANEKMSPYIEKNIGGFLRICEVRIDSTGEMRPE